MSFVKRYLVTGINGQLVQALVEKAADRPDIVLVPVGRPSLDLTDAHSIDRAVTAVAPDAIISAAAYTAVDQAEAEDKLAFLVNAEGPAALAKAAARRDIPIIHISTDYVFDGNKKVPYTELDAVAPLGVYGRSKLEGELTVAEANANHAILRTAWVYSAFGKNFLRTMLKVAETREKLDVVDDQVGNPTSAHDIAGAVLAVADNLVSSSEQSLRGVFHMTASGEASWADFAEEIFRCSAKLGGPTAIVRRIPTSAYPTPARRPANSRLDSSKLKEAHGIRLPPWQGATATVVRQLLR